jgi:Domain of unknown function (DUF4410)
MKRLFRTAPWLLALVVLAGCASTNVTERQSNIGNEKLARPDRIIVYDFAATPADIPAGSAIAGQVAQPTTQQTPEQIETGRKLGAQIAKELVAKIQDMGLPAVLASGQPAPRVNDIVIKGYLVSVEEGSAGKRILIGFGSGNAELKTMVEGFQMTDHGLRQLGSGELDSGGSKTPGMLVPLAVVAATANPIGLVVGGAVKLYGQESGSDTIAGSAKRTADATAKQLQGAFEKQGWI